MFTAVSCFSRLCFCQIRRILFIINFAISRSDFSIAICMQFLFPTIPAYLTSWHDVTRVSCSFVISFFAKAFKPVESAACKTFSFRFGCRISWIGKWFFSFVSVSSAWNKNKGQNGKTLQSNLIYYVLYRLTFHGRKTSFPINIHVLFVFQVFEL